MTDDADGRHLGMDMTMQFNALKLPAPLGSFRILFAGAAHGPADRGPPLR